MTVNTLKIRDLLADKGVDVEKVNLADMAMMMDHLKKTEKQLENFPNIAKQIPITIFDKEEINQ
ncbi:hypothetical protein [Alkalibacterium sp. MB6]|uniref:hypothetical protein n=1 Tax=Alkalibacterium sp. MB6 TaxID=2081965 RepID=UPI00137A4442|nr:hypothetical protein [Alkalibacterium sp. MB6]